MQQWDAFTIANEPVASIDLMERAAQQCTDFLVETDFIKQPIKIFCGKGNNGGDGLAIARLLLNLCSDVAVYIIEFGAKGTEDFQTNLQRLHELSTKIYFIQSKEFFPVIKKNDTVIDALYGSGLNRALKDLSAELVNHINESEATVISIDVPSGMPVDKSCKNEIVIKAAYTLTFQSLKLCFLMPENADLFGNIKVLDIGLDATFLETIHTELEIISNKKIKEIYKPRKQFSNKGNFGHALLIAGSKGKMGAAVIAAKACLRSGIGLLTVEVKEENVSIMQTSVPEAMCMVLDNDNDINKFSTIGIGPGIGLDKNAIDLLEKVLKFTNPVLVDADALNILSEKKYWLKNLPANSILTPHPKEFDRLFGTCENDFERMCKALELTKQYPLIIVLKGHYTLIAFQGKGCFNTTGNVGMATGGSGDMLSGILTSFLAQKYEPLHASLLGVYIHGLSADLALQDQSYESLLPGDMIEFLGKAFKTIA